MFCFGPQNYCIDEFEPTVNPPPPTPSPLMPASPKLTNRPITPPPVWTYYPTYSPSKPQIVWIDVDTGDESLQSNIQPPPTSRPSPSPFTVKYIPPPTKQPTYKPVNPPTQWPSPPPTKQPTFPPVERDDPNNRFCGYNFADVNDSCL